jgi:acetyltransferase-like isoleucine patch superfamily enzyme
MTDDVTAGYRRMRAGELYDTPDFHILGLQGAARQKLDALNAIPHSRMDERQAMLGKILGSAHPTAVVLSPVTWEHGTHIHLGDCFINIECLFVDGADIRIGDNTVVAPRVMFLTTGHPIRMSERTRRDAEGNLIGGINVDKPITVGSGCWIGAGAIICGGVTIGDNTTIGAGSIVTRSVPANVFAAGNPCRVIRELEP